MILVCGEALLDVFTQGRTPTGLALDARVGGSPFNLAVGLARMQQRVGFFGGLSRSPSGARLLDALRAEGVDTTSVALKDAPTTLSLIELNDVGAPTYAFYGTGCADRLLDATDLARLPEGISALCVGSYASVVEPTASTLREAVLRSRALVVYDPNVRLNVEPDAARWREQLDWMLPRCGLLKISDEDLALLHPGLAPAAFAARALAAGVQLVVVTRGAEGALGFGVSASASVAASACELVDTVGAGDSFQAALLAWLAEHDALDSPSLAALDATAIEAALAFAARAAAITCSRQGADPPRRAEF